MCVAISMNIYFVILSFERPDFATKNETISELSMLRLLFQRDLNLNLALFCLISVHFFSSILCALFHSLSDFRKKTIHIHTYFFIACVQNHIPLTISPNTSKSFLFQCVRLCQKKFKTLSVHIYIFTHSHSCWFNHSECCQNCIQTNIHISCNLYLKNRN